MRNQFIYFTGVLALWAAILAAPAQEITAPVNVTENTTVNATTNATVNETLNLTEALAVADMNATSSNTEEQPAQIDPGQDQTASTLENETSRDEAAGMEVPSSPGEQIFIIGRGLEPYEAFQVKGAGGAVQAYEIGVPIKPIRDLGKMFFVCNQI